jgi:hypothetical protein
MGVFEFIPILAVFSFVGFFFYKGRKETALHWRYLSEKFNIPFVSSGVLSGEYSGYKVTTKTISRKSGNQNVKYTQIKANCTKSMPPGLKISGNELFMSFLKLFGAQDIVVGIPMLDDPLIIKGSNPELVTQLFHRLKDRSALLSLCSFSKMSGVDGNEFTIEVKGNRPKYEDLKNALDALVLCLDDFANAVLEVRNNAPLKIEKEISQGGLASILPPHISKGLSQHQKAQLSGVLNMVNEGNFGALKDLSTITHQSSETVTTFSGNVAPFSMEEKVVIDLTTDNSAIAAPEIPIELISEVLPVEPAVVPPEIIVPEPPPVTPEPEPPLQSIPEPPSSVIEPSATDLPRGDSDLCFTVLQEFVADRPSKAIVSEFTTQWSEKSLDFEVVFDRLSTTFEMQLDKEYRSGKSLYGKVNGIDIIIRYPKGHGIESTSMKYKDTFTVTACFRSWDTLLRKAEFLV